MKSVFLQHKNQWCTDTSEEFHFKEIIPLSKLKKYDTDFQSSRFKFLIL